MKRKMPLKVVAVGLLFGATSVFAGEYCNYGSPVNAQAKVPMIQTDPVLADASEIDTTDPKWLALQKRQQLEVDSQQGAIIVPN